MKKAKPEKNWHLESGFELRKSGMHWWVYEGGYPIHSVNDRFSLEEARKFASNVRKSRNEQVQ